MPEKINIWGPPTPNANLQPQGRNTNEVIASTKPVRRIRWGLADALMGIGLMLALQILMAIGLVVYIAYELLSEEGAIEDFDPTTVTFDQALSGPFLFASALAMYLAWWIAIRHASKKKGFASYAKDFWLRMNWKRDILLGIVLAGFLRLAEQGIFWFLGNVVGINLDDMGNTEAIMGQQGVWLFINAVVVAALLAPFFEEVFFRGLFLQGLMRTLNKSRIKRKGVHTWLSRKRATIAIIVSSIAFGLMHFQGDPSSLGHWLVVIQTGLIGLIFAIITIKTKRLGLAIVGHIAFNLSGVLLVYFLG